MAGKEYAQEASYIRQQFKEMSSNLLTGWDDIKSHDFLYQYVQPIEKALADMEIPIELVIDRLDSHLDYIRKIADEQIG